MFAHFGSGLMHKLKWAPKLNLNVRMDTVSWMSVLQNSPKYANKPSLLAIQFTVYTLPLCAVAGNSIQGAQRGTKESLFKIWFTAERGTCPCERQVWWQRIGMQQNGQMEQRKTRNGCKCPRNGRELLLKGEGVQIRKGRQFAERQERLVWQQDAGEWWAWKMERKAFLDNKY